MNDELFEITFSGEIIEGADLDKVKRNIAQMFKADEARIAQMFSGHRVVIKRQLDATTAAKYRGAFQKAGALCEVRAIPQTMAQEPDAVTTPAPSPSSALTPGPVTSVASVLNQGEAYVSKYAESDEIPQALLTEPLGISAEQIEEMVVDVAPVGSQMQHNIKQAVVPEIDISSFDVAPVGSVLSTGPAKEQPAPPDTSGLSMVD